MGTGFLGGLFESEKEKTYIYKDGEELYPIIMDKVVGGSTQSKNADHLYMYTTGGNGNPRSIYTTQNQIDVTDYKFLGIEWEASGTSYIVYGVGLSYYNSSYHSFEQELYSERANFSKRQTYVDIQDMTGSYNISFGAFCDVSSYNYYGGLKVYKVWLLK
jgi:hypothetical protein